jgi:hypothetical protein
MDKMEAYGVEVSARELVVALEDKKGGATLRRFANTAVGHQALLRMLTRKGSWCEWSWKPQVCTGWM